MFFLSSLPFELWRLSTHIRNEEIKISENKNVTFQKYLVVALSWLQWAVTKCVDSFGINLDLTQASTH